ncbi:MAG: hypothetical protein NZ480_07625 [Bdellovibrionaceae bacterium]|nr:hypothetical protein [Pseudobdellovibrionaceae bacterium]MDW8189980.1 hypothetical protein [Pseudobdellovibrionaceae bacterium]
MDVKRTPQLVPTENGKPSLVRALIRRKMGGISSVEIAPVLLSFALLINFTLGFFGVIHSGILNSIAARNYAFETFRNRSNLNRLRDEVTSDPSIHFNEIGYRFHVVIEEGAGSVERFYATQRPIKFTDLKTGLERNDNRNDHSRVYQIKDPGKAKDVYTEEAIPTVWLKTGYGICLNSRCSR